MPISGTLILLIDQGSEVLAILPGVLGFADRLGYRLALLQIAASQPDQRAEQQLSAALAALPADIRPAVLMVRTEHAGVALATFSSADARLLAIWPARRGGLTRLLAGDDYELLLRESPLPLLILPADGRLPAIRRVLFPADFAPRSEAVFGHALDLCLALGAELHLLHVYGPDGLLPSEQDTARRAATASIRDLLAIDQAQLEALAQRASAGGVAVQSATAEGRAHTAIADYAAAHGIDLILMATHGPRNAEDILFGSTTARVIQDARAAVLAIPG